MNTTKREATRSSPGLGTAILRWGQALNKVARCQAAKLARFFVGLFVYAAVETASARDYPLNPAIDPCQNFYQHVCSRVAADLVLPANQSVYLFAVMDAMRYLRTAYHAYLHALLTRSPQTVAEADLQVFHRACLDPLASAAAERQQVAIELATMANIASRDALQTLLGERIDSGQSAFLMLETLPNQDNPDWDDIVISSALRSLPDRDYYANTAIMADFRQLATQFYRTLGIAEPEQRAADLLKFERGFAATFPSLTELRTIELDRRHISQADLLQRYPALRLYALLKRLPAERIIRDLTPDNYAFLDQVLQTWPLETLKAIYLFNALSARLDDAYPEYLATKLAFGRKHLGSPPQRPDREQRCVELTAGLFDAELDAVLLPQLFPNFPRHQVEELVTRVRQAALDMVGENNWLSADGKTGALNKLMQMRLQLVAPQTPAAWNFNLPAHYEAAQPLANQMRYWEQRYARLRQRLALPRNWQLWQTSPLVVDALYTAAENRFTLFQGLLQPPFFIPDAPMYQLLGSLGSMIGHELGHAIDDKGVHFDAQGRLHAWMTDADREQFQQRAQQLLKSLRQAGQNAEFQLAEQIGDLVGLQFAYRAAWPLIENSTAQQQEFFLAFARNWCLVIRPEFSAHLRRTDPHPFGAARVNSTLRQMPGFQRAFNCPQTAPMCLPAEERVSIW